MDLNKAYSEHQRALMDAGAADNDDDRATGIDRASDIARSISVFQDRLGAAAACAWSTASFSHPPISGGT